MLKQFDLFFNILASIKVTKKTHFFCNKLSNCPKQRDEKITSYATTYRPVIFLAEKRILEGYMCKFLLHREGYVTDLAGTAGKNALNNIFFT